MSHRGQNSSVAFREEVSYDIRVWYFEVYTIVRYHKRRSIFRSHQRMAEEGIEVVSEVGALYSTRLEEEDKPISRARRIGRL